MMHRFFLFLLCFTHIPFFSHAKDQQELVERSKVALESLMADEGYKNNLSSLLERAKAVLIIPSLFKAGFILGGEGGNGIVVSKLPNGAWSYPSFVSFIGGGVGLQIGFQNSEVLITVMTEKGLNSIMNNTFTLGADVSIAAGPVGAGLSANSNVRFDEDMYSYCHSKGLFGGGSLKGSVINAKDSWNEIYYKNRDVTPNDILKGRGFKNQGAEPLRALLSTFSGPAERPIHASSAEQESQKQPPHYDIPPSHGNLKPQDHSYFQEDVSPTTGGQEPKELLPWQRG